MFSLGYIAIYLRYIRRTNEKLIKSNQESHAQLVLLFCWKRIYSHSPNSKIMPHKGHVSRRMCLTSCCVTADETFTFEWKMSLTLILSDDSHRLFSDVLGEEFGREKRQNIKILSLFVTGNNVLRNKRRQQIRSISWFKAALHLSIELITSLFHRS